MKGLWYGDRRDRVKWGAVVHLAERHACSCIVQVAYCREVKAPILRAGEKTFAIPNSVWTHFSDLRQIERLQETIGKRIIVLDKPFNPDNRQLYLRTVIQDLRVVTDRKIVFLDPDTGIQPRRLTAEHVSIKELKSFWEILPRNDVLAVYQHANRSRTWLTERSKTLSEALGGALVHHICGEGEGLAGDVAILWAQRTE